MPELRSTLEQPEIAADRRARPAWRQQLVDLERGMSQGLRGDSTFFVYFFAVTVIIASAVVVGLSAIQWSIVILALTLVLSAEMFHQVLKALFASVGRHLDDGAKSALRIGSAAVFVAIAGSLAVIAITIFTAATQTVDV